MISSSLEINRWCKCGGYLNVKASPPQAAEDINTLFGQLHSGDGHGPADARTAANARRRKGTRRG